MERNDTGVGAAFGPNKPERSHQFTQPETAPLIAADARQGGASMAGQAQTTAKLAPITAQDETRLYEYEGNDSRCTSLSSLNSTVSDQTDWEDTFRAMGPKFHKLADLAGGIENDSGQEDSVSDGGTEIWMDLVFLSLLSHCQSVPI